MTPIGVHNVKTVAAKQAKQSFGQLLEDAHWGRVAAEASKEGFLGPEAGEALMNDLLNAKD